jgi:hypothetical protein
MADASHDNRDGGIPDTTMNITEGPKDCAFNNVQGKVKRKPLRRPGEPADRGGPFELESLERSSARLSRRTICAALRAAS